MSPASALDTLGRRALRAAQRCLPSHDSGCWILALHLVGADTGSVVDLPRDRFLRLLDFAQSEFAVRRLEEWAEPSSDSRPRLVLTFDDAFENFALEVWPVLRERGLPATLFIPTDFVDGARPSPLRGVDLPALGWDALRSMVGEGLDVGSHSKAHFDAPTIDAESFEAELTESASRIASELGLSPRTFCYPRARWSPERRAQVLSHYALGLVAGGRRAAESSHPGSLPRFPVRRDHSDSDLRRVLRAGWSLEEVVADWRRQR